MQRKSDRERFLLCGERLQIEVSGNKSTPVEFSTTQYRGTESARVGSKECQVAEVLAALDIDCRFAALTGMYNSSPRFFHVIFIDFRHRRSSPPACPNILASQSPHAIAPRGACCGISPGISIQIQPTFTWVVKIGCRKTVFEILCL